MPRVDELVAYPLKSCDGVAVDRAAIGPEGALRGDRSYALVEAGVDPEAASVGGGGGYVNGKSEPAIHGLRAEYDLAGATDATPTAVTLTRPETERAPAEERTFALPDEGDALADWAGEYLGYDVDLVRDPAGGFPDDRAAHGPTVVSRATLEAVASWFDSVADATEMRRRLRPNVVLGDCPAFFEDRLFADHGEGVRVAVGETELIGVNPCQRCVVPSRDPDTGAEIEGFRETFVRKRRETLPEWTDGDRFDHDFRLMVNTVVEERAWGDALAAGDAVSAEDVVAVDENGTPVADGDSAAE
ncbi:MOSC N-terminal beta barrel domain-containing protein [Halorubrum sp. 2020YC2]|uniref:MOSC domain-containing protein n=1 Tax=Halorubrum sp. 2020YC2 TaxID=2836432 RepID=UPI001BE9C241|nr:MOSC N-terminal beta barrel domain-containing protein [Halorubrum sp. 2020YC2]QWC18404.1 MOSC N-terminal beta barrel domain-containing protein [Halorubrum sp. 2020YC2]